MQHQIEQITTSDGVTLYAQTWLPEGKPKGMLAFAHGGGEHSDRYAHVAEALTAAGHGLHMADLRGYGRSPGQRGHIDAWEDYQRDLAAMMAHARKVAPDAVQFLGGHSLGGLIALGMALSNPEGYAGVVVSGPFLQTGWEPTAWKISLARVLKGIVPKLAMDSDFDPNNVTSNPAVLEAYKTDPMITNMVSMGAAMTILAAQERIRTGSAAMRLPFLIMHGTEDKLAAPAASKVFYEGATAVADKKLVYYEGYYHEIFNEVNNQPVLGELIAWLNAHS